MVASRGSSLAVRGSDDLAVASLAAPLVSVVLVLGTELTLVSVVVEDEVVLGIVGAGAVVVVVVAAGCWPEYALVLVDGWAAAPEFGLGWSRVAP
jgi:hypothetical protein